jgi:hypothetical protein
MSIGLISSCSVIWRTVVIGLRSGCSAIGRTIVGCGWINIGGIRGEAAAEAVAEVVVAVVWFIDCGRPAKGCWDCLFLFSYIYRVRKVVDLKRVYKINPIRCIGLIRSSITVRCTVSGRAILLIGDIKYIILIISLILILARVVRAYSLGSNKAY